MIEIPLVEARPMTLTEATLTVLEREGDPVWAGVVRLLRKRPRLLDDLCESVVEMLRWSEGASVTVGLAQFLEECPEPRHRFAATVLRRAFRYRDANWRGKA